MTTTTDTTTNVAAAADKYLRALNTCDSLTGYGDADYHRKLRGRLEVAHNVLYKAAMFASVRDLNSLTPQQSEATTYCLRHSASGLPRY